MDIWAHGLRFPETGAWLCYTRCHGQVQSFWQMYRPRVLPGYQQTFPHWYTKGILSDSGVCVNLWHRKQKHLLKTQMQQHTLICIGNKPPSRGIPFHTRILVFQANLSTHTSTATYLTGTSLLPTHLFSNRHSPVGIHISALQLGFDPLPHANCIWIPFLHG